MDIVDVQYILWFRNPTLVQKAEVRDQGLEYQRELAEHTGNYEGTNVLVYSPNAAETGPFVSDSAKFRNISHQNNIFPT